MDRKLFMDNYREAFGHGAELPIAFWFADKPIANTEKIGGCLFRHLGNVRKGQPASLSDGNIGCGGGKFYAGFTAMPAHVPEFVSIKEKYKQSPEFFRQYLDTLDLCPAEKPFLNFARIDQIESFADMEGLLFFATPDILSGLTTWAFFDNNSQDAVTANFGAGCSTVISNAIQENRCQGRRTFVGLFDPSVRTQVGEYELSFVIPRSRFEEMYQTMRQSCLFDTKAWQHVRQRINGEKTGGMPAD